MSNVTSRVTKLRGAAPQVALELPAAHGGTIELDAPRERLTIRNPEGAVQLTVRLTADGPVLSFSASTIELENTRVLRLQAERVELHATQSIDVESGGTLAQRIAGDSTTHCEGELRTECGSASVIAHDGALVLDSSHDVVVNGERVLINC